MQNPKWFSWADYAFEAICYKHLREIKYTKKPFSIDQRYALTLENKLKVFKQQTRTKKQLFMAMISANGIVQNQYARTFGLRVVTLEDFFCKAC
jgi:hypothetical protein